MGNDKNRILIVDDNSENIQLLANILSENNFDIEYALSGPSALELIASEDFDLILLDIMMPGMDGFEVCEKIKKDKRNNEISIIFLTAKTDIESIEKAFKIGGYDYVSKPFNTNELLARIRTHIELKNSKDKLKKVNKGLEKKVLARTEKLRNSNLQLRNEIEEHIQTAESLRRSEKKYRELQNNIPVGVYRSSPEGKFISVNQALVKMLGYNSSEELLQNNIINIYVNSEDRKNILEQANKYGVLYDYKAQAKRKDGSIFWMSISLREIYDENIKKTYYDGILVDITDRIKIKDELIKAKEKAEESDHVKSSFLSTISHELRAPLNAILGFSELINSGMPVNKIVEYNQIINKSGQHLLVLIEEIVNVSLLENKDIIIKKEEFFIDQVLEDVDNFIAEETKVKNKEALKIIQKVPKELRGLKVESDKLKLKHILYALLKNAIIYTNEGSIEYGYELDNDNNVLFRIKDTGIGIFQNNLDLIFESYRQVDESQTRLYGGLGLGLSIAKRLVEILGGRIWVESKKRVGSTFYFTIPYNNYPVQIDTTGKETSSLDQIDFTGKTILIAEDEEFNYLYLKEVLQPTCEAIIWAKNGVEAVEVCKNKKDIDLVLMDIKMPVMDGLSASRLIKEFRPELTIIAQTAYLLPEGKEKTGDICIDDYIMKPINRNEIIKLISMYIL